MIRVRTATLLLLAAAPAAAAPAARWRAEGAPAGAGETRTVSCSGRCPAAAPEIGPDCWWHEYAALAGGARGRLACLAPGDVYLPALEGLKVTVAVREPPPALLPPRPLPGPAPAPPAPAPAPRWPAWIAAAATAGLLAIALRRGRPARRVRAAARACARSPAPAALEALARALRDCERRGAIVSQADRRALEAARFGGPPLDAGTLRRFAEFAR